VRVFIGVSGHTCINIYVSTVFLKKRLLAMKMLTIQCCNGRSYATSFMIGTETLKAAAIDLVHPKCRRYSTDLTRQITSHRKTSLKWQIDGRVGERGQRTLDGMQPTLRQVPPRVPRFSMQVVLSPSCAALIAATYPPGPPPSTTTSLSSPDAAYALQAEDAAAVFRRTVSAARRLAKIASAISLRRSLSLLRKNPCAEKGEVGGGGRTGGEEEANWELGNAFDVAWWGPVR
jgi:hypothetical protein